MNKLASAAAAALLLLGTISSTSSAQQHPEATVVHIREADTPGWWLMDIESAEATWAIRLGEGCENVQAGPAALLIDGTRTEWLVLPDDTPGACHIEEANVVELT